MSSIVHYSFVSWFNLLNIVVKSIIQGHLWPLYFIYHIHVTQFSVPSIFIEANKGLFARKVSVVTINRCSLWFVVLFGVRINPWTCFVGPIMVNWIIGCMVIFLRWSLGLFRLHEMVVPVRFLSFGWPWVVFRTDCRVVLGSDVLHHLGVDITLDVVCLKETEVLHVIAHF